MSHHPLRAILLACTAATLTACGGGGGIGSASTAPPPAPPVTTPPPPTSPLPPPHIGLVSDKPFATLGTGDTYTTKPDGSNPTPSTDPNLENVQFSYDPSSNSYSISVPGFNPGGLTNPSYNGTAGQVATGSFNQVTDGSSTTVQALHVTLPVPGSSFSPYTYTSWGTWDGQTGVAANGDIERSEGIFAYGIPTVPGDVPRSGSASYTADIIASSGIQTYPPNGIGGTVSLLFDFGAGTLSGSMHPQIVDGWDGYFVDFGTFTFKNTIYSTGSTTFSGQFDVPGLPDANSFFEGNFTGPNAAEIMARFQTPYLLNGQQGTMAGIWIGKKN